MQQKNSSRMSNIPMVLQFNSSQVSHIVEERETSSNQNSSLDDDQLVTKVVQGMEDSSSDQNQNEEIQNHPDFTNDDSYEESFNQAEISFNHSQNKGQRTFPKKQKNQDHSLKFFGKILFLTFIICVLMGIFAAVIEQSLKSEYNIPNQEDAVEKSLTVLFNDKKNNLNTKKIKNNQEFDTESLKKSVKITGKVTIEKNLKNEDNKEEPSSQLSSSKIQTTENTSESRKEEKSLTNSEKKASKDNSNEKNEQKSQKILVIKGSSAESNVNNDNKNNNNQEIKQNSQNKQTSIKTENVNQSGKNEIASVLPMVYPPGNMIPEPQCSKYILQQRTKYGGLYQFTVNRNIFRSNSNVEYFLQRVPTKITKQKYVQAVDLLEAIHNIDQNGQITAKDTPCESGEKISDRIKETIQKQTERLNKEHQMDSYFNSQLRFCIVTNSYKNALSGLIYRNIDSILQQNYTNYHVVYTDDNSPDQTGEKVQNYLKEKNIPQTKIKVKINDKKVGMMENIYNAITYDCQEGEIAVMLDGDDSFIGTNVLSLLNALYQKKKVALMWNNFLQINENSRAIMGFSRDLDGFENNFKSYRITHRFVSSHLKSFFVDLFRKIKKQDLQQNDGKFFGGASDTAMMMPMLEMAFPRFAYVPEVVYQYRFDTGQVGMTVNRLPQAIALTKIGLTEPYTSLRDFSFVEDAIKIAESQKQMKQQQSQVNRVNL